MSNKIDKLLAAASPEQQKEVEKIKALAQNEGIHGQNVPGGTPDVTQSYIPGEKTGYGGVNSENRPKAELKQPNAVDRTLSTQQEPNGKLNENLLPSNDYKNLNVKEGEKTPPEPIKDHNAIDRTLSAQAKAETKEAGQTLQKNGVKGQEMER